MTQTQRLREFLQTHPDSSTLEIQLALTITNVTGRMSDLRDMGEREGFEVVRSKRADGHDGYRVNWLPKQLRLEDVA